MSIVSSVENLCHQRCVSFEGEGRDGVRVGTKRVSAVNVVVPVETPPVNLLSVLSHFGDRTTVVVLRWGTPLDCPFSINSVLFGGLGKRTELRSICKLIISLIVTLY